MPGRTIRSIGVSLGAIALVLTISAAAAASGRVAIVNGISGKTVEICVNGNEIKSGLKYGQVVVRRLANGNKTLNIRQNKRGTCRGATLGKQAFSVVDGTDLTIVGTKFADKVLVYENTEPLPSPGSSTVMLRHAADVGSVGFKFTIPDNGQPWFDTAADDPWVKGAHGWGSRAAGVLMVWWAHLPPNQQVIAGPYQLIVESDMRHESILVGSNLGNVRFVRFKVTADPS